MVPHFPTFERVASLAALVATLEETVSFKSRTSRIRLPTAVLASRVIFKVGVILSSDCWRTAAVSFILGGRHQPGRRRQDFLISLLSNVSRVGD